MKLRRRTFYALTGLALGFRPAAALSQRRAQRPLVTLLLPVTRDMAPPRIDAVRAGLRETGLLEGVHYDLEVRVAEGRIDHMPDLAQELHLLRPAVFLAFGNLFGSLSFQQRPPTVFSATAADPVQWGVVESYSRPGGMVTGNVLTALGGEDTIAERRVSLFKELVPGLTRLAMIGPSPPPGVGTSLFDQELRAGARIGARLGFETRNYRIQSIDTFADAVASALRDGADGLYLSSEPLLFGNFARVVPLVLAPGLPTVGPYAEYARAGVLMTYSADLADGWRRAGVYAGRILHGAKPGDLPIEQPTKFSLVINAKTARQLGIAIPVPLEAMAGEVIDQ